VLLESLFLMVYAVFPHISLHEYVQIQPI